MANATLLDNIQRLRTWDIEYLTQRLSTWRQQHRPAKDDYGCIIASTVGTNGYAKITLSRGPKQHRDQWHVNAYTLIAFIEGKMPPDEVLQATKHPVASHLCGRGALGCCNLEHIVFGESQKINLDRLRKRCNRVIECSHCGHKQVIDPCTGHGDSDCAPRCI